MMSYGNLGEVLRSSVSHSLQLPWGLAAVTGLHSQGSGMLGKCNRDSGDFIWILKERMTPEMKCSGTLQWYTCMPLLSASYLVCQTCLLSAMLACPFLSLNFCVYENIAFGYFLHCLEHTRTNLKSKEGGLLKSGAGETVLQCWSG